MKPKTDFSGAAVDSLIEHDGEERQLALEYIAEAWNAAEEDGVEPVALAHASLFAALTTLVRAYGEEAAAELVGGLPDRLRSGEYNLSRSLQ
jgi:hypothetical protein